jgi:hypothetical protein
MIFQKSLAGLAMTETPRFGLLPTNMIFQKSFAGLAMTETPRFGLLPTNIIFQKSFAVLGMTETLGFGIAISARGISVIARAAIFNVNSNESTGRPKQSGIFRH